jgi:hypothetical protein
MLYKKKMFGGNGLNSNPQIEKFLAIIIIGYFSIKIIYPLFFNYYPEKYYYNTLQIHTNEKINSESENTENITLNAYVPGMWNNEITDFITLIVLSYIIFVFTHFSNKSCIDNNGIINLNFLIGYIIGLGYPIIQDNYHQFMGANSADTITYNSSYIYYLNYFILSVFVIYITSMNFIYINNENNNNGKINYAIFIVALFLLLSGLIFARKKSNNYSIVNYFYSQGEACSYNNNNSSTGVLQTSGDVLNLTFPFVVFIILLLFSYEPNDSVNKNLYILIYGLLLGSLVSSVSYYGFQYFLEKRPLQQCSNPKECALKQIDTQNYPNYSLLEEEDNNVKNEIKNMYTDINLNNSTSDYLNQTLSKYSGFKLILMIVIIIIIIYLIYFYFKK